MPGLVPGIHVLATKQVVDGRDKPGHDEFLLRAKQIMRYTAALKR
jgi:hypothetical protein